MENYHAILNNNESKRRMVRTALAILDSTALAEEIVQEAYIRLLESEAGSVECPTTWLVTVTRNLALDLARRRIREREFLLLIPHQKPVEHHEQRQLIDSELSKIVSCLLHVSDPVITAKVLLNVVFGMHYKDIAAIDGRSPAACRQAVSRAIRNCARVFNKGESFDDSDVVRVYVQAILDASMVPLVDSISVASPNNLQGIGLSHACRFSVDLSPGSSGTTKQVLVLTATGVQWALVFNGVVLCQFSNTASAHVESAS